MMKTVKIILVIVLFFSQDILAQRQSDSLALVRFFRESNGTDWLQKWDLDKPMENWHGVGIDPTQNRVVSLVLPKNGLFGQLSELPLSALKHLELSENRLSGGLDFVRAFTVLENLKLSNNFFSGNLILPNSRFLKVLDIQNNQISGQIPPTIKNHPFLEVFSMANNQISGSIPQEMYGLVLLRELDLANNQISGRLENEIGNLINIEILNIEKNQFNDFLPESIANWTRIKYLDLSHNQFLSGVPRGSAFWNNIEFLDLSHNGFSGVAPTGIAFFLSLQYLDLSYNNFQASLFEIGNLTKLEYLNLSYNKFFDGFGQNLGNLRNLKYFNVSNNILFGTIPEAIGNLSDLTFLDFSHNRLTLPLPNTLNFLRKLEYLDLSYNNIIGKVPFLDSLKNLKILRLNHNLLEDLPIIHLKIKELSVENNRLGFDDLEDNMEVGESFSYIPQDTIEIRTICQLTTNMRGRHNVYQWFFENEPIANSNVPIWKVFKAGRYAVQISNTKVKGLVFRTTDVFTEDILPMINLGQNLEFSCGKFEQILSANAKAERYLWSTGDTLAHIKVSRGGLFWLKASLGRCEEVDSVLITYRGVSDNIISFNQDICTGDTPKPLVGRLSAVGIKPYFLWQKSNDAKTWQSVDTTENYTPPKLTAITYYRRIVWTDICENDTSNVILVRVSNISISPQKQDILCAGQQDSYIRLNLGGGLEPYEVRWQDGSTDLSRSALLSGTYTVEITDFIGCKQKASFVINEPEALAIRPEIIQASCSDTRDGGSIFLNISGGNLPYRFIWSNGNTTENLINIPVGRYTVKVQDRNNCEINFSTEIRATRSEKTDFTYEFEEYCSQENNVIPQILGSRGGVFEVQPTGLSVDAKTGEINWAKSNIGQYQVTYKINDCSMTTKNITFLGNCQNIIPNTLTINNDGVNDVWDLGLLMRYEGIKVQIFDRWGTVIFNSANYEKAWDFRKNGVEMPQGTYFYILEMPNRNTIKGFISLLK